MGEARLTGDFGIYSLRVDHQALGEGDIKTTVRRGHWIKVPSISKITYSTLERTEDSVAMVAECGDRTGGGVDMIRVSVIVRRSRSCVRHAGMDTLVQTQAAGN